MVVRRLSRVVWAVIAQVLHHSPSPLPQQASTIPCNAFLHPPFLQHPPTAFSPPQLWQLVLASLVGTFAFTWAIMRGGSVLLQPLRSVFLPTRPVHTQPLHTQPVHPDTTSRHTTGCHSTSRHFISRHSTNQWLTKQLSSK